MTDATTRLSLPLLVPGQAQKEMFHNEALALLDLAVHAGVVAVGIDTPPDAPAPGAAWIVGDAPTGAWAGRAGSLAGWTEGGWRFVAPVEGMAAWDRNARQLARFDDGGWVVGVVGAASVVVGGRQVVGPQQPAVADPAGGDTVDQAARAALTGVLAALRAHGLIAG